MELFSEGIVTILVLLGQGFILEKMGEKFWKGIIPFYGTYLIFKKVWETKYFWSLIGMATLTGVFAGVAGATVTSAGMSALTIGCMVAACVVSIAVLVEGIMLMYKLAKAFGHGAGYTVGLVVLEPIFVLLLGLNKDKYQVVA